MCIEGTDKKLEYTNIMDPTPVSPQISPEPAGPVDKISQSSRTFVKNHYEDYIRFSMGWVFSIINFIKSSIINIINQVLDRE